MASIRPSWRISSIGPRVVAVKVGKRDKFASSRVCSSASTPRPCIQSGADSRLDPFLRSTVMLNASPVNKSRPRLMFSLSPISPPTFTVSAWTKSFTTLPKSTRSPRKNERASMPSSSPNVGSSSPSESTSDGNVSEIFAGRGSK